MLSFFIMFVAHKYGFKLIRLINFDISFV